MASGGATVARLRFEFIGDLTGYRAALKTAQTEGDAAAMSAGLSFKQSLGSAFRGITQDLRYSKTPLADLRKEIAGVGGAMKSAFSSGIHKAFNAGLNVVKGTLSSIAGMAKTIGKGFLLGAGFAGFQAIGAQLGQLVTAIPDLITKGRDYINIIDNVADSTGASAEETSKFVGTLAYLGVPLNGLINMIGQASRNLELMTPRLEALGIVVEDSNGLMLDQIQILFNARHAMSEWGLGAEKANIIAREFGRGGLKTLVDFLNLTDEQFEVIVADLKNAGLIITEAQRNMAEAAVREGARFEQVWTGLGTTLFSTVGPAIMAFMSRVTEFIRDHVEEIKNAVANVVSFLFGLVSSLLGMSQGLDSFSMSIQAMSITLNPYSAGVNELTDEITRLNGRHKQAVATTADARRGYEAQIKVVDKQIAALDKLVKAEDRVYAARMKNIKSIIDEKLAMLDAAEAAEELAQKQLGLNEQLNQAQIALAEAQRGDRGKIDADAIAKAMQDVVDAQRAIAELAREQEVAGKRATLTNAQSYIEDITKLVEEAENRKALAKTLGRREAALADELALAQEKGNAEEVAIIQAKLDATRAAAEQNAARMRTDDRRRELDERKAMLEEEKAAVRNTAKSETEILIAEKQKQLKAQQEKAAAWEAQQAVMNGARKVLEALGLEHEAIMGDPKGPVQGSLDAARLKGIEVAEALKEAFGSFGAIIEGIVTSLGSMVTKLGELSTTLGKLFDPLRQSYEALPEPVKWLLGINVAGLMDELFKSLADVQSKWNKLFGAPGLGLPPPRFGPSVVPSTGTPTPSPSPRLASGGLAGARGPERAWLGEQGSEWVINNKALKALSTLNRAPMQTIAALAGGGMGGSPAVIRLEIGGRPLLDYMDEHLEYRRRI